MNYTIQSDVEELCKLILDQPPEVYRELQRWGYVVHKVGVNYRLEWNANLAASCVADISMPLEQLFRKMEKIMLRSGDHVTLPSRYSKSSQNQMPAPATEVPPKQYELLSVDESASIPLTWTGIDDRLRVELIARRAERLVEVASTTPGSIALAQIPGGHAVPLDYPTSLYQAGSSGLQGKAGNLCDRLKASQGQMKVKDREAPNPPFRLEWPPHLRGNASQRETALGFEIEKLKAQLAVATNNLDEERIAHGRTMIELDHERKQSENRLDQITQLAQQLVEHQNMIGDLKKELDNAKLMVKEAETTANAAMAVVDMTAHAEPVAPTSSKRPLPLRALGGPLPFGMGIGMADKMPWMKR